MGLEYVVLSQKVKDYRVQPWTPADSLAWLKAMAWDLRGDYDSEPTVPGRPRARRPDRRALPALPLRPERADPVDEAWTPQSRGDASAIPGAATPQQVSLEERTGPEAKDAYAAVQRALAEVPVTFGRGRGIGSNAWVVGPEKSSTGKPLLANDPHLGVGIPGIWYQVGLHCRSVGPECPFDVSGFSFAGMPGVVIGHNQASAWSMTNLGPDVTDFYLEQVREDTYLRDGRYVPLTERRETIKVAGAGDHTITVRSTAHGPLLSEAIDEVSEAGSSAPVAGRSTSRAFGVSLAWTGLIPSKTADSIFGLNSATTFEEFREAAKSFAVPSQNLLYADREGHIGYQAPGRSRSAARTRRARCRGSGPPPAGVRTRTGRASCPSRACRTPTTRRRASSSPPTRR